MSWERKAKRVLYLGQRGVLRLVGIIAHRLPEGGAKRALRKSILRVQNSLPTELAVNRGDVVVQIGTPHPKTMRRFVRAVGPSGRLVIVEALPQSQDRLQAAIDADGLKNVLLIRGAAYSKRKEDVLLVSPYAGDNRVETPGISIDNDLRSGNADMERITVSFFPLDEVLPEHGVERVDYLSVTVNGAEIEVLKGAEELLRNGRPGARVYAKGHAMDEAGQPIHLRSRALMESLGYSTIITRGELTQSEEMWDRRAGDLFAWK